ncbi:sialoadhesin-like [Garra rufa]|uniref:sialoadhesin-like n=1 Tax=Garra rufa TaxID=137080 RepID=UPI003CCEAB9C
MALLFPLLFSLMIHDVVSAGWGVSYSHSHICALKDSSVIMRCTYTYPTGHQIMNVFWTKKNSDVVDEDDDLSEDPEYNKRLKYLGNIKQTSIIRLSHVTLKDSHKYYFKFSTKNGKKELGYPGVSLTVTDLQVESPERVTEGDSVRLTCKSSCTLTDRATFIWYRNSQPLTERRDTNNQLLLQSVRREDAGRYSCALHGHTYISPDVHLNVMYPPKNISVSISPSGEMVEGDSVTLSCSSDSNPPAEISWFKGGTFVGSGRIYNISKISSDHSGEYKCKSINKHGEKYSDAVNLNIMYRPRNVSVKIKGYSVTLICSSDSNPPALNFSWFKENQSSAVGSGQSFSALQSGRFYCEAHNQHGSQRSDAVTVNVKGDALVISVRMAVFFPLLFSLMIHDVSSADWGVSYSHSHICALKDSSVIMSCTYTYPTEHKIKEVFWTKRADADDDDDDDLSNKFEYRQRFQYLGNKQQNCTIRLSHVTLKDSRMYYFRFTTNKPGGTWIGKPGVSLTVTDLQVESPERVTEGDSVRLTCKSSCTLTDRATFIWYRNSQPLTERRDTNNQLLLQSVRREDAGRYSCALHGHTYISPDVYLNVMYPPRNISVSISPSGEIVEGDSVTLICSSDSNPPAEISWFKGRASVGSGRIYNISNISSDHSGEYKCKSNNKHGEKYSDAVNLNIMYPPRNVSVKIKGGSVTLICSSDSNPPALNFSWFKEDESSAVGSGQSFSALQSGRFYCEAHNQHGSQRSDTVTVTVKDVSSAGWGVSYSHSHICALKDSSVIMSCTYTYPTGHKIMEVFWTKKADGDDDDESEYRQRLQYLGDKQQNCTIRLSHVTQTDSHMYYFRFTTNGKKAGWIGERGVNLTVTDLQVESPERVTEGDSVRLTCKSSCTLTDRATFIWYRNSQPLTERRDTNNQLLLQSVRREDAGRYSCALHGHTYISPDVHLNVMYPPRNISVSISPSGEIVEGISVTLNCSSDSNPPSKISWFKGGTFVGSGRIYNISKISSDHSGEYKCKTINKHGEKYSDAVNLNIMYRPRNVSVKIKGDSVTLICSSDSNPPALNFSWFKENQSSAVGSGQSFSALQSGRFYCEAHNQHGSQRSDAVTVTVKGGDSIALYAAVVIAAGCVLFLICIIMFMRFNNLPALTETTVVFMARVAPKKKTGKTPEMTEFEKIEYTTFHPTRQKR